jgi:DNA-binding NtrC family response regulator
MPDISVLVVDDDLRMRQLVRDALAAEGIASAICADGREAARLLQERNVDVLITDLMMPHLGGIELLEIARQVNPDCMVILITGYGSIESAVEAIRKGAYDYIQKPFEPDALVLTVCRAREHVRLVKENRLLRQQVGLLRSDELIGNSQAMTELKSFIAKIAPFDTTVLIQGETGTGKELVAKLIHQWSPRKTEAFLPVNCGALPEQLLEAELFGHKRGSFTGATQDKKGLFETVGKGTIFLDEINSISAAFQVKLLRVLQEGSYLRVGGREPRKMAARVIVAGNVPLEQEVEAGRFRSDLFYRLNVFPVVIPPLRERIEDIDLLAHYFVEKFSLRYERPVSEISAAVIKRLRGYPWPGNVRELENVIERAVIVMEGTRLETILLPHRSSSPSAESREKSEIRSFEEMERHLISLALSRTGGSRQNTAELLKISPVTLWRKMKKYQIH